MRHVCLLVALAGVAVLPSVATAQSSLPDSTATASGLAEASLPAVRLYMPDGQLKSHLLRVFLTGNVQPDQQPRLQLFRSHAVPGAAQREEQRLEPSLVAPGQEWTEVVDGKEFQRSGTVLLFNARDVSFGMRATIRVIPALVWTSGGTDRRVLGSREVNVGNIVAAISWTVLVVGLSLLVVMALAGRDHPVIFLTGVDGHLSLAQTQVALWTIVVGSVVLGYGLVRLQIPDIPASLVVLMGASLATGGVAYFQDAQKQQAVAAGDAVRIPRTWALGDLVRLFAVGQPPALSLAKAQMLFWTLLLLVLFISKSILDGAIWEVPWPLVALMGFSQAGYLAPKLASTT